MSGLLRGAVSKKKRRYQKDGFDLDLSYITPKIIAMGFPSDNMEGVYRNPWRKVLEFLDSKHKDHYKIYNLCSERSYDIERFYSRVECFPFDDHNAPPFDLIHRFCENAKQWIDADPENIIVVHCKAGKGRTGVMICTYLLFDNVWKTADESLNFYAAMRTFNQKGVTIPSQLRYIRYFATMTGQPNPKFEINSPTLILNSIEFNTLPKIVSPVDVRFSVSVGKTMIYTRRGPGEILQGRVLTSVKGNQSFDLPDVADTSLKSDTALLFKDLQLPVQGDVKFDFFDKNNEKLFSFWINTYFIKNNTMELNKSELDKANKDRSHKSFEENFKVRANFSPLTEGATPPPQPKQSYGSREDGPIINEKDMDGLEDEMERGILNARGICVATKRNPCDVASDLLKTAISLVNESKGGSFAERFKEVRRSKEFQNFCMATCELQKLYIQPLQHSERVAFWLNVYHTLCIHGFLLCGARSGPLLSMAALPSTFGETVKLLKTIKYDIGGVGIYSAMDIQFGILRNKLEMSPQLSAKVGTVGIAEGELRQILALTNPEPRVAFAINWGTRHSPKIRVYQPLSVFDDLDKATRSYIQEFLLIDPPTKTITLPETMEWDLPNLGKDTHKVAKKYSELLSKDERKHYSSKYTVDYLAHDSSFCILFHYN
eukprot:TRINITY_DN2264_c0_g1_i1.p1 TRINITY_DN2264_c0_g1~~TRINITY_DN2264_c0_g1_i1.p1  ORF type:complete len:659 (-),score=180.26 TRINITY_DN2264_c0_g1_i1:185-2161(-)